MLVAKEAGIYTFPQLLMKEVPMVLPRVMSVRLRAAVRYVLCSNTMVIESCQGLLVELLRLLRYGISINE